MNINNKTKTPGPVQKLTRLLAAPTIEPSQRAARIQAVEKDIVLPLRAVIICILTFYFFFSGWLVTGVTGHFQASGHSHTHHTTPTAIPNSATADQPGDWIVVHSDSIKRCFMVYVGLSVAVGIYLFRAPPLSFRRIKTLVFFTGVLDAALWGMLIFLNTGFDSILYLVLPVMILHNALSIPVAWPQIVLNFILCGAFMGGGVLDLKLIAPHDAEERHEIPLERLIVLVAWSVCCYGIQVLFEKQKRAEAEATEFAVRQERLHTAGRLAAEIAHQIKNPLGIITNAAFSLQRSIHDGNMEVDEQIQIIREEIEHADRIITELMGYAQLAEGSVERLEVSNEVDNAILEVLPPAAKYKVEVVRNYDPSLPALLMQKRHLSSVLVNLLQNAREAMRGVGRIEISVQYGVNDSVIISIADNGPGIAPDKIDKIFEAHFSTREKGTGLGLAIVKHNTEIYGGKVSVESELGKGTRFTLEFPARILMRLSK